MPLYFFHLPGAPDGVDDPEGQFFAGLEEATEYTYQSAREVVAHAIGSGQDHSACTFEIRDAEGRTLTMVTFSASRDSD